MTISRFLIGLTVLAATAGHAFAQTAAPAKPAVPAVTQPAAPAKPVAAQPAAQVKKININTATAAELDTLKGIGEARAKKIIEERAKAKFKNFDDLVKRSVLPANVE
ncbi:MAG: ComEA family DNA-binding protein, partial [Bosea sp. (in: a-proteobacteria)]